MRRARLCACVVCAVLGVQLGPWLFAAPAQGYFPGVDLEPEAAPSRAHLLQRLQEAEIEEGVEEHTAEVALLREQTALLAQELRLLRELLADGALASALADAAAPAAPAAPTVEMPAESPAPRPEAAGLAAEDLAMAQLLSSGPGFRHPEALQALSHLSKRVVERRVAGELPLGQVPELS
ncbi:unnamed protein product [Effrenium voratum]|nr:unnamed protein product [Effrenium voratum]